MNQRIKYTCLMSNYPKDKATYTTPEHNKTVSFYKEWTQTVVLDSEEDFRKWKDNHPWKWNLVKVIKKEHI